MERAGLVSKTSQNLQIYLHRTGPPFPKLPIGNMNFHVGIPGTYSPHSQSSGSSPMKNWKLETTGIIAIVDKTLNVSEILFVTAV